MAPVGRRFEPRNKLPDSLRTAVRQADEAGDRTRQDIAREFGIHPSTLTKWLGPKHPMRDRYKSYDRRKRYADQIREMHWEGHTYMYIAKTLGIPSSTVWDYINRPYKEG